MSAAESVGGVDVTQPLGIAISTSSTSTIDTISTLSNSSKNECGLCGPEQPASPLSHALVDSGGRNLQISPSAITSHSLVAEASTRDLVDHFWIICDICEQWYHGKCVDVEEYESALIDKYHCPRCSPAHGPMKEIKLDHRYSFDDLSQKDKPTQIGTKKFIDQFKRDQDLFPTADTSTAIHLENGHDFAKMFQSKTEWTQPYLIDRPEGLGLKMPESFSVKECIALIGENRFVDTIDVYKQHTYHMKLSTFYEKFCSVDRPRLYNILSLEFSNSKLSQVVQPPQLVWELSWVHRFWPDPSTLSIVPPPLAGDVQYEHLRSKPEVALFCLIGMQDSFTDFHIDFGGSSVWYHVFQGQKVFYVVEPTDANLKEFLAYQKDRKRSEHFFGDRLPANSVKKIVVNEGNTFMIPSGWIHAVWTPADSLVFGGNFLHSLNIAMQLRIHAMEIECETDDRFMFPSFELTNWYAARSILEALKDANEDKKLADDYLVKGAQALLPVLKIWMKRDRSNKKMHTHATFSNLLQKLQKEVNVQAKLRKMSPATSGIGPGGGLSASDAPLPRKKTVQSSKKTSTKAGLPSVAEKDGKRRKIDTNSDGQNETSGSIIVPGRKKPAGSRKIGQAAPVKLKLFKNASTGTLSASSPVAVTSEITSNVDSDMPKIEAGEESMSIRVPLKLTIGRTSSVGLDAMGSPSPGSYTIKKDSSGFSPSPVPEETAMEEGAAEVDWGDPTSKRLSNQGSPLSFSMIELKKAREAEKRAAERLAEAEPKLATTKITIKIGRAVEATSKALTASHKSGKKVSLAVNDSKFDESGAAIEGVDFISMFSGKSSHGREHKPAAWIAETAVGTPTAKKFPPVGGEIQLETLPIDQPRLTLKIEKPIGKVKKKPKPPPAVLANETQQQQPLVKSTAPVASGPSHKKKTTTAKQRLASKLKIKL